MGKSCGGVRCSEPGWAQERKEKCFFNRDSKGAFGSESAIRGGSFGLELDGEKLWRGQVFGARMGQERKEKCFFNRVFRGGVWERKCEQGRLVLD